MSVTFKVIKTTEHKDKVNKTYVVAHKGRAMVLSTLSFDDAAKAITITGDKLTVNEDIAVVQRPYVDAETGMNLVGLNVMPKFDIAIDAF